MKITAVTAVALTARFADYYGSEAAIPRHVLRPASHFIGIPRTGQYSTLVTIETDDGRVGFGEAWGLPLPEATALWIERLIAPVLLGRDPADIDGIWFELTGYFARIGHSTSVAMEAVSGIDLALWDLAGKAAGRSVAALLGRKRDAIDCYVSPIMFHDNEAATREAARAFVDEGFKAIKMKAGRGVDRDLADARAISDEVGSAIGLLVDVNGGYDLETAIALAEGLAPLNIVWLEEPLPPARLSDMAALRRRSPVPIAIGENEFNITQFWQFFDGGCADIVMPNVTRAGGITGCRAIASLAAEHGAGFSLHGVGAGLMQCASLQLLGSLDAPSLFEVNRFPNPLRDKVTEPAVAILNGRMAVPDTPGLGCMIDAEAVTRFRATS